MSEALRELGVEAVAVDDGGFELRSAQRDWLMAVFRSFSVRADAHGRHLRVGSSDLELIERVAGTALAPDTILFDLDGVLADISRRSRIAAVDDVAALAEHHAIGVVTTCPHRLAESVLERHGFLPHVGAVVGSEDGPCKPDPFPVQLALRRLGRQRAWMLGDNPSDVTAARGAQAVPFAVLPRGIGAESHIERLQGAGAVRLVEGVASLRQLRAG
ncbi:MAG: HAD family hydrolase [Planctomycetota bacterium]